MKEPVGLPNYIETILKMEDSNFCRMLTSNKQTEHRSMMQNTNVNFCPAPISNQLAWKNKQQAGESGGSVSKNGERNTHQNQAQTSGANQNQVKLSEAEYAYKKRNGLCYKCLKDGLNLMFVRTRSCSCCWS